MRLPGTLDRSGQKRSASRCAAVLLAAALILPSPALAQTDPDNPVTEYAAKTFDVIILRPLALVTTIVGSVLFLPAALVSAPGGRDAVEEAFELFVVVPGKNTFTRPLGDF